MLRCELVWEDEPRNRHVHMHVTYTVYRGKVVVRQLDPLRVTIAPGKAEQRVLPVTREAGRRALCHAFLRQRDRRVPLEDAVLAAHGRGEILGAA